MIQTIFIPFKNKEVFGPYTFYVGDAVEKWINENIGKGYPGTCTDTSKAEGNEIYQFQKSDYVWCYEIHASEYGDTDGVTFHIKCDIDKLVLFKLVWGGS